MLVGDKKINLKVRADKAVSSAGRNNLVSTLPGYKILRQTEYFVLNLVLNSGKLKSVNNKLLAHSGICTPIGTLNGQVVNLQSKKFPAAVSCCMLNYLVLP